MKKTKTKQTTTNKPTLVAFLLDRTGSMSACRDETIKGFNGYIKGLREDGSNMRFTLTQFDSIDIDIVHDAVPLGEVKMLNEETYEPRAQTPLYDAIGKTVRATEAKAGEKYKVLFVTLTDGQENASSEWTRQTINDLIKEKEEKDHWTFAHIGVGANGWAAAQAYSVGTRSFSNVLKTDHKNTAQDYHKLGKRSVMYARCATNSLSSVKHFWGKNG